jgi:hypothetical protein
MRPKFANNLFCKILPEMTFDEYNYEQSTKEPRFDHYCQCRFVGLWIK